MALSDREKVGNDENVGNKAGRPSINVNAGLSPPKKKSKPSKSARIADEDDAIVSPNDDEDDFDFLSGTDETATKLDLARAYIDMGDAEGARDILDEVVAEGNEAQQQEARDLIGKLA